MGLEKAVQHGKEHRKSYSINKQVDPMCRNHGGCAYCLKSRTYRTQKELAKCEFSRRDAGFGKD